MKKITSVICIFFILLCTGCGKSSSKKSVSPKGPKLPHILVETEWLQKNLDNKKLTILDVRKLEEYNKGHIDGAISYPIKTTYHPNPKTTVEKNNLAPIDHIEKTLGKAGINLGQTVVLYDGGGFKYAARVFWVLEAHGHKKVAVLNGGYPKWVKEKRKTSTKSSQPTPKKFISNMQPEKLVSKLEVMRVVNNKQKEIAILDVRSTEEYTGKKTITPPRAGHIPGAGNTDWVKSLQFNENICTVDDLSSLRKLYSHYNGKNKIITYCNKGKRASASYFVLRLLGYEAGVYDGSWLEWGLDKNLPIEK